MLKFAFLIILLLGGSVMAKDGTVQAPRAPIQTPPNQSDQDRYMDELYQQFEDGKIDLSQAKELFEKRFGPDPSTQPKTGMR